MRQRLAGQHLVAHRRVVNEDRFDRGGLREIARLQAFVSIHIRVVGARDVVELVLNKLEARNANVIERFVIRALQYCAR